MSKSTKRKEPDAAAVIDDLEQQMAKLRKLGPTALKSNDVVEFGNKLQAHAKRLEKLEAVADVFSKKKQRDARNAEKECELKRIVAHLLPPDMQYIEVKRARVFADGDDVICDLWCGAGPYSLASCTFNDGNCIDQHQCGIEIDTEDGVFCLFFVCKLGDAPEIKPFRMHINTDNLNQFNQFERDFSNTIRNKRPEYRKVLGTRPVWAYVLLSMLVYSEHVFAPLTQKDAQRVQCDVDERGVHKILKLFWAYGSGCKYAEHTIAPFLVRLMPPVFALKLALERDAKLFY